MQEKNITIIYNVATTKILNETERNFNMPVVRHAQGV